MRKVGFFLGGGLVVKSIGQSRLTRNREGGANCWTWRKRKRKHYFLSPDCFVSFLTLLNLPPVMPPSQPGLFYKVLLTGLASQFVNT